MNNNARNLFSRELNCDYKIYHYYYRTFYGPILHFLVTFYSVYEVRCDQKVWDQKMLDSKNFSTVDPLHLATLSAKLTVLLELYKNV